MSTASRKPENLETFNELWQRKVSEMAHRRKMAKLEGKKSGFELATVPKRQERKEMVKKKKETHKEWLARSEERVEQAIRQEYANHVQQNWNPRKAQLDLTDAVSITHPPREGVS